MEELVKTFHIDAKLLIAQLVNFTIVLFVLYKFAYQPILKTLNDRTAKIDKGLKDAEAANKKIVEMGEKEKVVLAEAKQEAQKIIARAEETAKKNKEQTVAEMKQQSEKILQDTGKKIEEEKQKMLIEVKGEIAGLVVAATEKLIGEKIDSAKDKSLIDKALEQDTN
ncbi:ATP synthase F0 subunit B [Patescibacteria group bacterium]|nr:MAG: ATP synthase F0 subunit B [Patescibacteria group bacterium]